MSIFLITYFSNNLSHSEAASLTSIFSDRFTTLSECSFLIETTDTQIEIQETISSHISQGATFQVIPICKFSYGPMPHWLAKKILKQAC
jgi:hypothetical protein